MCIHILCRIFAAVIYVYTHSPIYCSQLYVYTHTSAVCQTPHCMCIHIFFKRIDIVYTHISVSPNLLRHTAETLANLDRGGMYSAARWFKNAKNLSNEIFQQTDMYTHTQHICVYTQNNPIKEKNIPTDGRGSPVTAYGKSLLPIQNRCTKGILSPFLAAKALQSTNFSKQCEKRRK